MLSRLVIAFLPRSKLLLISWLQSPSAVIWESKKIKFVIVSTVFPSICHEVMGPDAMILLFWMLSFKPAFLLSSFTCIEVKWSAVARSCPTLCDPMDYRLPGSSVHGIPRQEYWSGLPFPSPGNFLTYGLNPGLPHWRQTLYCLSHKGSIRDTCIKDILLPSCYRPYEFITFDYIFRSVYSLLMKTVYYLQKQTKRTRVITRW